MLSHHNLATVEWGTLSSCNNFWIHINSTVALARALYSASVLDLETVGYFLALQEIRLGHKKTAKPLVDLRSSRHLAQSASANALSSMEDDFLMCIPRCKVPFIYCKIRLTLAQCLLVGECKNWRTLLTEKEISGRVRVRYCRASTILLYLVDILEAVFKSQSFDLNIELFELHTIYRLRMLDITMMTVFCTEAFQISHNFKCF
jgi:hypothetical protein